MSTTPKVNPLFSPFSRCVSAGRIERYRRPGDDDLETLTRYAWNICLCEALYPVLQILEVGFRNSIHDAATDSFGTARWYKTPGLLHPSAENMITEAESELTSQGKPLEPGRVVAELNFGFWTNLLNRRYEQNLWPRLIRTTFPYLPARIRTRHTVYTRFDKIRWLRNRIFHHESILHVDLQKMHTEILDAMGWVNPAMKKMAQVVDRFSEIHTNDHYNKLKAALDTPPKATEEPTQGQNGNHSATAVDPSPPSNGLHE